MKLKYDKPLTSDEWAKQANLKQLEKVINCIEKKEIQVWAEEICKIIPVGSKALEIGCGTGISSLWLANNGRNVTALDYTDESIELVRAAANKLHITINTLKFDATKELPFEKKEFDYAFQCGLLEHFDTDEQIRLLRLWSKNCKVMVSMIPNSSSIAYRIGKEIMEKNGSWQWGLEIPRKTLVREYRKAGYKNIREYSIGSEWALRFLPEGHYLKETINRLIKEDYDLDGMMQGYLLVTIGES